MPSTRPLLALLVLLSCEPEPPPTLEPQMALGVGEATFAEFADGDTLGLVSGCQGLQHVWTAVRAQGLDPRGTLVDLSLRRVEDGELVSQVFRVRISMQPVDGMPGVHELYGLTVIVPEPEEAIGRDLTLRATITDRAGVELTDERPVRIDWAAGGCRT
ncbi:MAG: hypothetical protein KF729_01300 [Sandaracinaceae bacterium]|nr:hypothetical protein [Sandaracinaceae bacterium]